MTTPAGGRVSVPALRVVAWPIEFGGVFGDGRAPDVGFRVGQPLLAQDAADLWADEDIDSGRLG